MWISTGIWLMNSKNDSAEIIRMMNHFDIKEAVR